MQPCPGEDPHGLMHLFSQLLSLSEDARTLVERVRPRLERVPRADVREASDTLAHQAASMMRCTATAQPLPILLRQSLALLDASRRLIPLGVRPHFSDQAWQAIIQLVDVCERIARITRCLMDACGAAMSVAFGPNRHAPH